VRVIRALRRGRQIFEKWLMLNRFREFGGSAESKGDAI